MGVKITSKNAQGGNCNSVLNSQDKGYDISLKMSLQCCCYACPGVTHKEKMENTKGKHPSAFFKAVTVCKADTFQWKFLLVKKFTYISAQKYPYFQKHFEKLGKPQEGSGILSNMGQVPHKDGLKRSEFCACRRNADL